MANTAANGIIPSTAPVETLDGAKSHPATPSAKREATTVIKPLEKKIPKDMDIELNVSCPNTDNIGRIHAGIDENKNLVFICARFGPNSNDIVQDTLPNPY